MKIANLLLIRESGTKRSTTGRLFLNGVEFCFTLEDVVRGVGIKIPGETAIPAGTYKVRLSYSSRFKRVMPMVYTEANGYELKAGGISFLGIRIHGGNTHLNTDGCILVAFNKINDDLIQGTAEKDLTATLQEFDTITLKIQNA